MAKRRVKKPEERLAAVINTLRPVSQYDAVKILRATAVMLSCPSFSHEREL